MVAIPYRFDPDHRHQFRDRLSLGLTYPALYAGVADLADALDLGSSVNDVGVQVPSPAPKHSNPNLLPIGETFGFVVFLKDVK